MLKKGPLYYNNNKKLIHLAKPANNKKKLLYKCIGSSICTPQFVKWSPICRYRFRLQKFPSVFHHNTLSPCRNYNIFYFCRVNIKFQLYVKINILKKWRGLKKTASDGTDKQTNRHPGEHDDSMTESAQWADSVKSFFCGRRGQSTLCPPQLVLLFKMNIYII